MALGLWKHLHFTSVLMSLMQWMEQLGHTCLVTVDKLFIVTSDLSFYNKEVNR